MPDDAGAVTAVTAVVAVVDRDLRAAGAAPAFRLAPAMQASVGDRLPGVVVLRTGPSWGIPRSGRDPGVSVSKCPTRESGGR
jgi:hypothetical protein